MRKFWVALLTCLMVLQGLRGLVLAQPAFTQTAPGGVICTPTVMNLETSQTWYAQADGSGVLQVTVAAVAVNPEETGALTAELLPPGGGAPVQSVTLSYPASGETQGVLAAGGTAAGQVYAVRVTLNPPVEGAAAHHYRLRIEGASLAGVDPMLRQFEHDTTRWFVAVGAGESLGLQVNPGEIAPAQQTSVWVYDPAGNLVPGAGATQTIAVPGAAPGLWSVLIEADGHYRLDNIGGADRGIYLTWASYGKASLTAQLVTPDGLPYMGPARVRVTPVAGGPAGPVESFVGNGVWTAGGLMVGAYRVEAFVDDPGVRVSPAVQDVALTCDGQGVARFVVTSTAPPPVEIAYTGDRQGQYSDEVHLAARLTRGGAPVAGKQVEFTFPGQFVTAVTGPDGVATAVIRPMNPAGQMGFEARWMGDPQLAPARTWVDFDLRKEDTVLTYSGESTVTFGSGLHVAAVLGEHDPLLGNLGGKPVHFALQTGAGAVAVTDGSGGTAGLVLPVTGVGTYTLTAAFAEDPFYLGSQAGAVVTVVNSLGKVTSGNLQVIEQDTGRKTAGFVIQADSAGAAPTGQFQFQDHGLKWNFHSERYTGLGINPEKTEAVFAGTGTLNGVSGYTFQVRVRDLGEPSGKGDSFAITIWDAAGQVIYSYDGGLTGGNVQIHK